MICNSGIGKGVIGGFPCSPLVRASNHSDIHRFLATASSTGLLLKTTGLKVTSIKIDPYMNIDAGTMAPTEHGESPGGRDMTWI